MKTLQQDELCRRMFQDLLPNIADYVARYAKERPKGTAIIEHNTGETVTWKQFETDVSAFAAKLLSIGLVKGDIVATSLPLLKEHIYLIYACYRIGVIVAPLDLRLKAKEVITCMEKMKPKAFFFLGNTPVVDFRPIIREVMAACPFIRHWVQFQKEADLIMEGAAGAEKPKGEVGEICFSGPQVFLGYLGDPENTAKTVSKDGVCYTGDVGYYDEKGLHFSGRAKLVIKPKGYQVFPEDVESHIHEKLKERAGMIAIVGVEHEIFSEGIMAFVECQDGKTITPVEVLAACSDISAYSRPSHVVILKAGEIPLNRVAKTDYLNLRERAAATVRELRAEGKWDRG